MVDYKIGEVVKVYNTKTQKDHYGKIISISEEIKPIKYIVRIPCDLLEVSVNDIKKTDEKGIVDWINRMEFVEEIDNQTSITKYSYRRHKTVAIV